MSTVKTNNILNTGGTAGIALNPTTKATELVSNGFNLAFDGINIIPQGKTRAQFVWVGASDQQWVVPVGVTSIYAKLWAAGGAGGHYGGWSYGSHGGAGGHTRGIIPVTPGETLTIRVPRGGYANPSTTNAPFGGGSATSTGDNSYAGGGGGYCGIFRSTTPLLIAGAGGGGGAILSNQGANNGGAGGGYTGRRGEAGFNTTSAAGGGGTQTAGGSAGSGGNTNGGAGSYLQGGSCQGNNYGGGGGGGYYGGGSGAYNGGNNMAGGGGGSGYIHSSVIMGATYPGTGRYPSGTEDIDYPASSVSNYSSIGFGGIQQGHGGDGFMVIYY
jgi:hypothetical protein